MVPLTEEEIEWTSSYRGRIGTAGRQFEMRKKAGEGGMSQCLKENQRPEERSYPRFRFC